jgi:lipopolysaccharide/colanic/teichoic acid biosynthesis glycosyltransferase
MYKNLYKRVLGFILTLIGFVIISPVFLILCILVRIKLGSPVFFTQIRITKGERPFRMIKFRTMTDARDQNGHLLPDTERITKFGTFLRNSSLDELPELINVLKGDMSLVGPRPLYPLYLPYYKEKENLRHTVRAGITGLAQINGRAMCKWDDRFAMDVEYVNNMSLINDIKILWRTFFKVAAQEDASIPSVTEEEGLHILREVQQPEKIAYVEEINKEYGVKQMPVFVNNNQHEEETCNSRD